MKKIFILGTLLCAVTARADVPTLQYVLEYYANACGWPGEEEWIKSDFYPELDTDDIATQWIALNLIDGYINGNTTYATDLKENNVMSSGYLDDTLSLINNTNCCAGKLRDFDTWQCVDGCPAANPKCCTGGTIWDWWDYQCVDGCPANNKQCCPDTWDKYDMRCVTCPDDSPICCPNNWDGNRCVQCPITRIAKTASCPDGWERVEARNMYWVYNQECPDDMSMYLDKSVCAELDSASVAPQSFDICIPPVDGEIVTFKDYFTIGDNCANGTCATSRVYGIGRADYGDERDCICIVYSLGNIEFSDGRPSSFLKRYDTADECTNSCAYDCAYAIQTMPGFRHNILATDEYMCDY